MDLLLEHIAVQVSFVLLCGCIKRLSDVLSIHVGLSSVVLFS